MQTLRTTTIANDETNQSEFRADLDDEVRNARSTRDNDDPYTTLVDSTLSRRPLHPYARKHVVTHTHMDF